MHDTVSAAVRPQGAADSNATSLLSFRRHRAAGGDYALIIKRIWNHTKVIVCAAAEDETAWKLLRNQNDASGVFATSLSPPAHRRAILLC